MSKKNSDKGRFFTLTFGRKMFVFLISTAIAITLAFFMRENTYRDFLNYLVWIVGGFFFANSVQYVTQAMNRPGLPEKNGPDNPVE